MLKLIHKGLVPLFLRIGFWLYNFIIAKRNNDGDVTAIHFAVSEREMNISMREHVERLDENTSEETSNGFDRDKIRNSASSF